MNQENPIRKAHDYMQDHGWVQETFKAEDGSVCLIGALCSVTRHLQLREQLYVVREMEQIVSGVCRDQYGPRTRIYTDPSEMIVMCNDKMISSEDEALTILDKAAVRWDEVHS